MLKDYEIDVNPAYSNDSARGKGVPASQDNRCPCCDSPRWCFILDDGNAAICGRSDEAPDGWERTGTAKDGRGIFSKDGKRRQDQRYKGILPAPDSIALKPQPRTDFPQWVEIGSDHRGGKELQIEYLYPDPETGKPLGKVVRRQWDDRRAAYDNQTKHLRPWHWVEPYHPEQGDQGWWSDRGKGSTAWPLYREAEVATAITSGECEILINGTGEQAVETFRRLGFYSVSSQGGESNGHDQIVSFLKSNTPKVFVLIPDEDEAGHIAAAKLQAACDKSRIPAITINLKNVWSALPLKGDITDVVLKSGMADSEIVRRLEAEIRRAIVARRDDERKLNDPDEKLKLELQALLSESDPIKRMRKKAEIASHYRLRSADIEQALKHLEGLTKTQEPRFYSLSELFDLPQTGIEYLVPGMLPVGETVLLVADPKAGKTLLAYDLAFAIATGEDAFLGETVKQGRVLIVQCDESRGTATGRLIKRGFRHEDGDCVQFMDSFSISQMGLLEERLEEFRPSLVIIDSLRRINAGREVSENSAEFSDSLYQLKELLTRYGSSGILIHHSNKSNDAVGVGRVRGSSSIAASVWGVWQLEHIPKPDPDNKKRSIIDPKDPCRILSIIARDVEGQRLRIELDPERNQWNNLGEVGVDEQEVKAQKSCQAQILELLKSAAPKALEAQEINEVLGLGRGVYAHLNRLLGKRLIGSRPSTVDRRRTVYFCFQDPGDDDGGMPPPPPPPSGENRGDTPPPTPPVPDVIEYAESYSPQAFHRSITDRSQSITIRSHPSESETSKTDSTPGTVVTTEIDHKNRSQGGGGGLGGDVIDLSTAAPTVVNTDTNVGNFITSSAADQARGIGCGSDDPWSEEQLPLESKAKAVAPHDQQQCEPVEVLHYDVWQPATLLESPNNDPDPQKRKSFWHVQLATGLAAYIWSESAIRRHFRNT